MRRKVKSKRIGKKTTKMRYEKKKGKYKGRK